MDCFPPGKSFMNYVIWHLKYIFGNTLFVTFRIRSGYSLWTYLSTQCLYFTSNHSMSEPFTIVANSCKTISPWRKSWDLVIKCFGLGLEEAGTVVNTLKILAYCPRSSEMSLCLHYIMIPITHGICNFLYVFYVYKVFFFMYLFICFC